QLASIIQRRKEPRALANDMAARFIFDRTVPYARPLVGFRENVAKLTRDDVAAFHRARFAPDAAAVMLVGEVDAATARTSVMRYFADWGGEAEPAPAFDVTPHADTTTIFIVDRPGSVQSEIRVGHIGVPRSHRDYFALEVMNALFGGA